MFQVRPSANQDGSLDRAEFARFEPIMNANEEAKQHADEHSIEIQSAVPQILNSAILEVGVRSSREQSARRWIVLQE